MDDFDPMDVVGQEDKHLAVEAAAKLAREEIVHDFLWLMKDKRGRRIVWRALGDAGVFHTSFTPDPYVHAFQSGRRDAGLKLLAQINEICPELYTTMMKEQLK